jgi:hypothetical protein
MGKEQEAVFEERTIIITSRSKEEIKAREKQGKPRSR